MTAGYSKRTLVEKLGIKECDVVAFFNPPDDYFDLLGELPDVTFASSLHDRLDFIHFFTSEAPELQSQFPKLKSALSVTGQLWISWQKTTRRALAPSRASRKDGIAEGLRPDQQVLTENIIRKIGLANGLVDVKVIAIDETWSGLKFVYRIKDRK